MFALDQLQILCLSMDIQEGMIILVILLMRINFGINRQLRLQLNERINHVQLVKLVEVVCMNGIMQWLLNGHNCMKVIICGCNHCIKQYNI